MIANAFMPTTLRYLQDEEYRIVRQLEALEAQSRPYNKEVAEQMIDLAQQLAQLHWTESVLAQVYDTDLHFLPRKAKNIDEIRERLANGERASDLAKEYEISESAISRYKLGTRKGKEVSV